jgi:iron complex transport system substrate-binding protein
MLGLQDAIAGVTRYCAFPPEAAAKPRVGGYIDPSVEAVYALKPDLVVMLSEQAGYRARLERLGIETLEVDHGTVSGILGSMIKIGTACGKYREGLALERGIRSRMERIQAGLRGAYRPRVLVCVGRNMGSQDISDVYAAGEASFHHELIGLAGGRNAVTLRGAYPQLSSEGIMSVDPDVIIDMVPAEGSRQQTREDVTRAWRALTAVRAVRDSRVYVLTGDYSVIPGPRFIELLEDMARVVHPEVGWK